MEYKDRLTREDHRIPPPSVQQRGNGICPRGHEITGYNNKSKGPNKRICRTCFMAFQWAKNHNLFYDNPLVLERMAELYARYREM